MEENLSWIWVENGSELEYNPVETKDFLLKAVKKLVASLHDMFVDITYYFFAAQHYLSKVVVTV